MTRNGHRLAFFVLLALVCAGAAVAQDAIQHWEDFCDTEGDDEVAMECEPAADACEAAADACGAAADVCGGAADVCGGAADACDPAAGACDPAVDVSGPAAEAWDRALEAAAVDTPDGGGAGGVPQEEAEYLMMAPPTASEDGPSGYLSSARPPGGDGDADGGAKILDEVSEIAIRMLEEDPEFVRLREEDALGALASMFEREDLPGDTARSRYEFVLDYVRGSQGYTALGTPFTFGRTFGSTGFHEDFRDDDFYPEDVKSNQVGHFLMASTLGSLNRLDPRYHMGMAVTVGHEKTSDGSDEVWQGIAGIANPIDSIRFSSAVGAAKRGDREAVNEWVSGILTKTGLPRDAATFRDQGLLATRQGNSHQDLALSAYGYALAHKIYKDGSLKTPADVGRWLRDNLGS